MDLLLQKESETYANLQLQKSIASTYYDAHRNVQ